MSSKANRKQVSSERQAKVEELRAQQARSARRRKIIVLGSSSLVALAIVAAAAIPLINKSRNDPAKKGYAAFGVSASAAGCTPATTDQVTGNNDHRTDGESITYATAPPSSGPHYAVPAAFTRKFYTASDRPPIEQLVHNLEHGYTILWYLPSASSADKKTLEGLAAKVSGDSALAAQTGGKFIVAPWDTSRGAFEGSAKIAMSHWGAKAGTRQYCGQLSGGAVRSFVNDHPYTDSPEPNAA